MLTTCTLLGERDVSCTAGKFSHIYVCVLPISFYVQFQLFCHHGHVHGAYFPAVQLGGFVPTRPQCRAVASTFEVVRSMGVV